MKKSGQFNFEESVVDSFQKRRKALRHQGVLMESTPVREIIDGRDSEFKRVDITLSYRVDAAKVMLRLAVWGDGWIWVDVRRHSKKGWAWEFTTDGRMSSVEGARALTQCAEATINATMLPSEDVVQAIQAIWVHVLARGPRRV